MSQKKRNEYGTEASGRGSRGASQPHIETAQRPGESRGSTTVRRGTSSAVMNTAEIPYWGCWAQTDPGASLGCFAGDPAPGPVALLGQAVKHKQDARVGCRSPGKESHVSQRPKKPLQQIHTLNLCSLKTGKQPLEHIYCFNLNK